MFNYFSYTLFRFQVVIFHIHYTKNSNDWLHYEGSVPRSTNWGKVQWRELSAKPLSAQRSYNSLLYIVQGSDYFLKKYTWKTTCTNHTRWWLGDSRRYKIGLTVEAFISGELFIGFLLYPLKYLPEHLPIANSPGLIYFMPSQPT